MLMSWWRNSSVKFSVSFCRVEALYDMGSGSPVAVRSGECWQYVEALSSPEDVAICNLLLLLVIVEYIVQYVL